MGKLICAFFDTITKVRMYGLHLIFMSLLFYMFQMILNIFFFLSFLVGKINYFHGWGLPPPPPPICWKILRKKKINSIFKSFPKTKRSSVFLFGLIYSFYWKFNFCRRLSNIHEKSQMLLFFYIIWRLLYRGEFEILTKLNTFNPSLVWTCTDLNTRHRAEFDNYCGIHVTREQVTNLLLSSS